MHGAAHVLTWRPGLSGKLGSDLACVQATNPELEVPHILSLLHMAWDEQPATTEQVSSLQSPHLLHLHASAAHGLGKPSKQKQLR